MSHQKSNMTRFKDRKYHVSNNFLSLLFQLGSKILLSPWVPFFNSRFNSMLRLADFLVEDGHDVSILIPPFLKGFVKAESHEVITFDVGI